VSWGKERGVPNQPDVYADVAFYNKWIEGKLHESSIKDEI
jgi:secreted trypsin-like serine protease